VEDKMEDEMNEESEGIEVSEDWIGEPFNW